jgi:hypothetical protein
MSKGARGERRQLGRIGPAGPAHSYREVKDQLRYLGLYEGPYGIATDYATADSGTLARLQGALGR